MIENECHLSLSIIPNKDRILLYKKVDRLFITLAKVALDFSKAFVHIEVMKKFVPIFQIF